MRVMSDFPFQVVAFDLDGTLLDTHRDLGEAVNYALKLGGFGEVPIGSSKDLIGGGAKVMLGRAIEAQGGLPDNEFHGLYKKMLGYYSENNAVHSRPYPGVTDVLDTLDARGVKMAVVTNKFESFATDILSQLDLAQRFVTIIGGDSLGRDSGGKFRAKPAPDPILEAIKLCDGGRYAFVCDSTYDVASAKAAGVPVVAAAYGYCDKPENELGADAVIEGLDELVEALAAL